MRGALKAWEAFWFEREMEASRVAALRVIFFGLLGLDLVHLMVAKGYRYGTAGFNVAHMDWMNALLPVPNATLHTTLYLVGGFLALRIAAGMATRFSLYLLTAIYGYAYFSSLNDGYQHHYLLFWVLVIFCFMPLERTPGLDSKAQSLPGTRLRSLGFSLLYAQVSIVYLFTAITKHNPSWWNGWALEQQISTKGVRELLASFERLPFLETGDMYSVVAVSVFAWQMLAAASFVFKKLRPIACISGPLFHVMVEVIGLEIRWFSYYMIALYYLLLFPETWYAWVARALRAPLGPLRALWQALRKPRALGRPQLLALLLLGSLGAGTLAYGSSLPGAAYLAGAITALVLIDGLLEVRRGGERLLARLGLQLAFAALLAWVPVVGGGAYDYYRYAGGDFARRGEIPEAIEAYYAAIDLNPGPKSRHAKLGELLLATGEPAEAREVFERGLEADPKDKRLKAGLAKATRLMEKRRREASGEPEDGATDGG